MLDNNGPQNLLHKVISESNRTLLIWDRVMNS